MVFSITLEHGVELLLFEALGPTRLLKLPMELHDLIIDKVLDSHELLLTKLLDVLRDKRIIESSTTALLIIYFSGY